jgi:hypothetical protein
MRNLWRGKICHSILTTPILLIRYFLEQNKTTLAPSLRIRHLAAYGFIFIAKLKFTRSTTI